MKYIPGQEVLIIDEGLVGIVRCTDYSETGTPVYVVLLYEDGTTIEVDENELDAF